ncbi:hypothetical protein [Arthrobacter agilis]|uniref:hypothetical protein n=1 Tax=Arthrobacter agilis TaxID=37921 RepID=UPI0027806CA5|nr:hypothetical protein [Arthrobacter agilis]MDQ0734129.1 putative RDD family membrane protein YckC [Arthrobacter agilis]
MTANRDPGTGPPGRRPARLLPGPARLLVGVAVAVFAASLGFVLLYTTSLPAAVCILIAFVLGAAQLYALRGNLFRSNGTGGGTRDGAGDGHDDGFGDGSGDGSGGTDGRPGAR